jgi:predicted RNA binding protein YcfA (HicA-like mRNA interferase family)
MTKLPSSEKVIVVLLKNGFHFKSPKGSHRKYADGIHTVIVPAPRKEIPLGTVKSISKQSGISYDAFINL